MNKNFFYVLLMILLIFSGCKEKEESVQFETIDGVPHVMNPELPLKGTVLLELEKKLEIDPYEHEEIGLQYFEAVKDNDGEVILFDANKSEVERFNKDGEYLGRLFRKGQGPGEFKTMSLLYVRFMNNQIWVTGRLKLAKYDKRGQFIDEFKLGDFIANFIDQDHYVTEKRTRKGEDSHKKIMIKKITESHEIQNGPVLMEGMNLGMIRIGRIGQGGFGDAWGTPDIEYAVDRKMKRIYVALNTEYKIHVKDVDGHTLYVIERPYEHVTLSRKDKEVMLESFFQRDSDRKPMYIKVYPDKLAAIRQLEVLPNGYLAVYRISGLKEYELDVFDDQGRYLYQIEFPDKVNLERESFYDFGFSTIETADDFPVYVEYQVKNLREIFSGN
jgi:hypothetical protein